MLFKLNNKKKLLYISFILISVLLVSSLAIADEDEDNDDFAKNLGYIAIGLFVISVINIGILYVYRFSRKFFKEVSELNGIKETTRNFYLKTRKPLNYVHYFVGLAAVSVLIIHGINLTLKNSETVIIGWIAAGVYIFYILTGLIIKLKIKPIWKSKKTIRILNKIHQSIILFISIIIIHIVHVLIVDRELKI